MLLQGTFLLLALIEELRLQQIIWCRICFSSHRFIKVKKEKWRLWKCLFRENRLISLLNLLQVEDSLPFTVRLVAAGDQVSSGSLFGFGKLLLDQVFGDGVWGYGSF